MPGELWQALLEEAGYIHAQMHRRDFSFLRVLADGAMVVQAYGVLEVADVAAMARHTAPHYPEVQTLEVYGVRPSASEAITKRLLVLEAENRSARPNEGVAA